MYAIDLDAVHFDDRFPRFGNDVFLQQRVPEATARQVMGIGKFGAGELGIRISHFSGRGCKETQKSIIRIIGGGGHPIQGFHCAAYLEGVGVILVLGHQHAITGYGCTSAFRTSKIGDGKFV